MDEKFYQNAINPNNVNSNNENNATNTFNLIIGIATLLIAILGATFAYFSATARSAENDVTVKSAFVSISYDGGTEIKASNLIPATQNVALKKYQKEKYAINVDTGLSVIQPYNPEVDGDIIVDYDVYKNDVNRKCVDAKGKEVCYVYQFSIESDGVAGETTDILASIKVNKNEFDNLSFVLYEVDFREENGVVLTDKYGFGIVDVSDQGKGYQYVRNIDSLGNLVGHFAYTDTNDDNIDFVDAKFDKFIQPFDLIGENEELVGTVNPVVCLFGYAKENYTEDYETDKANVKEIAAGNATALTENTERCAPYPLENKVKHTYQLVIWLEETGYEQPEQGLAFEGTVTIEVSGGFDSGDYDDGQITGKE